jgi:hypothetical protein
VFLFDGLKVGDGEVTAAILHKKRLVKSSSAFLYSENHALDAWFKRAFSGEIVKALQMS